MKTIALDFDDTYTVDPRMWDMAIVMFRSRGFRVVIVTARRDTEENRAEVKVPGCQVYFTELASKLWWAQHYGLEVDIWIDNDPHSLVNGH